MSKRSPTINRLILAGITDGEFRKDSLVGLSRLSPYLYIGGTKTDQITVAGYYNCPALAHFRVAVREITKTPAKDAPPEEEDDPCPTGPCDEASFERGVVLPNMFDLDTRNLYLGQLNQSPGLAQLKPGEAAQSTRTGGEDSGEGREDEEETIEGKAVKGLPMRLQQVHFRAFKPNGQSDEYSAYFLASNPVGPFKAKGSMPIPPSLNVGDLIDSDFNLQKKGSHLTWTNNDWTKVKVEDMLDKAADSFSGRLVIGDPLAIEVSDKLQWRPHKKCGKRDPAKDGKKKPSRKNSCDPMFDFYDPISSKDNVFRLILDGKGFIVRQPHLSNKAGKDKDIKRPKSPEGLAYSYPLSVVISNRYRFFHGSDDRHGDPGEKGGEDNLVMEWYDDSEFYQETRLLIRPEPKLNTFIGCVDEEVGWQQVAAVRLYDFCKKFPRIVTKVESTCEGIYEHAVTISCAPPACSADAPQRQVPDLCVSPVQITELATFATCGSEVSCHSASTTPLSSTSSSSKSTSSKSKSSSSKSSSSKSSSGTCAPYKGSVNCGTCGEEESSTAPE